MSDNKNKPLPVTEYYNDLYELHGAVMDAESYARHKEADPAAPAVVSSPSAEDSATYAPEPPCPAEPATSSSQPEVTLDAVFSEPQDLRQIAAKQIEADRRIEYRPECVTYVIPRFTGETCIETETRMVFDAPHMVRCGSGSYISSGSYGSYLMVSSYRTSGSYVMTEYSFNQNNNNNRGSGSYRSSGSFRLRTSGSYRGSGSFRLSSFRTSGSYRGRSSFRLSSGSYRPSSQCFCIPVRADEDKPYMGSFGWDFDLGGYGLDLI